MQQVHIRGGGPNEVVKTAEKILLNPVIERLTNLTNVGLLKDVTVEDILKILLTLQLN